MSNPSIAEKLMSLVKGVFGRKEPTPGSAPAPREADTAPPSTEAAPAEEARSGAPAADEAASEAAPAEEAAAADTPAEDEKPDGEEREGAARPELSGEEKQAIAEEIAVAEAETQVASDQVLDQVRRSAAPAADALAVPSYDELTLPSIRARLRKLTIEQVRDLRAYEVAHGGRSEFIRMYDNRIAKLEAENKA